MMFLSRAERITIAFLIISGLIGLGVMFYKDILCRPVARVISNSINPSQIRQSNLIDINKASVDDFEALPKIGNKLAQRIVEYRSRIGRFVSISQLIDVKGINESVLDKIKGHLVINNE